MKNLFFIIITAFNLNSFGVIEVGDLVPNLCYKNQHEQTLCLKDTEGQIRVLVHGSGWCPDCQREIVKLVERFREFDGKGVVFYNLLAEGFKHKDPPDSAFLKAWTDKYKIPFPVASTPKNPGKQFFEPPSYIPNYVVVGRDGRLIFKSNESEFEDFWVKLKQLVE